jgi:hypothetical protein
MVTVTGSGPRSCGAPRGRGIIRVHGPVAGRAGPPGSATPEWRHAAQPGEKGAYRLIEEARQSVVLSSVTCSESTRLVTVCEVRVCSDDCLAASSEQSAAAISGSNPAGAGCVSMSSHAHVK